MMFTRSAPHTRHPRNPAAIVLLKNTTYRPHSNATTPRIPPPPTRSVTTPLTRRDSDLLLSRRESVLQVVDRSKDQLRDMLNAHSKAVATDIVPWFINNLPATYFQQVSPEVREQHLRALAALRDTGMIPNVTLKHQDGTLTLIRPTNEPGQLLDMLTSLERMKLDGVLQGELAGMQVYVAKDNSLSLNLFQFSERVQGGFDIIPPSLLEYVKEVKEGKYAKDEMHVKHTPSLEPEALLKHIKRCRPSYVANTSARRFCLQKQMYDYVTSSGEHSEKIATEVEKNWARRPGDTMLTLALTSVEPLAAISRVSRFLSSRHVDISRVQLDVIPGTPMVTMLRVLTTPFTNPKTGVVSSWNDLDSEHAIQQLARASKWLDDRVIQLCTAHESTLAAKDVLVAEVTVALSDLCHALLSPLDPYQYARSRVLWCMTEPGPARDCAEQIIANFCRTHSSAFAERHGKTLPPYESSQAMIKKINHTVEQSWMRAILEKLVSVADNVLRTNLNNESRSALSFRINAEACMGRKDPDRTETPFGIFFVHGRRFAAFHLRFRDIARGGLRIVTPSTNELRSAETARHFNECYDLAFAQQLKNKDIAEGGAKAVILADTVDLTPAGKHRAIRRSVRAFTDSMLDILAPNSSELLYLGPDEQIIPEDIAWIADRAVERKYPLGRTFISSKREDGINHKVYGVTSEGVAVFLDAALRTSGIDPSKRSFTIKITGGPDGDVAGNMLKILHREYGDNARVVGICDATGAVEDPQGIHWPELLRLVQEQHPLDQFDTSKLSGTGKLGKATEREGLLMRNTLHMRVPADAFVPAGGRPATINANNWKTYLNEVDAQPSSRIIVEGANLFLTPHARQFLSVEGKCLIVKDSSANKCGVICSSYEVLSGMVLPDKAKFLQVKEQYVKGVLARLRYLAGSEASLLMREWRKAGPGLVLPEKCVEISHAVMRLADSVAELEPHKNEVALGFVAGMLPLEPLLMARGHGVSLRDKITALQQLPQAYLKSLVSKVVASECVYREGVDYFIPFEAEAAKRAMDYVDAVVEVQRVADTLVKEGKEKVGELLRLAAPRAVVDHGLKGISRM